MFLEDVTCEESSIYLKQNNASHSAEFSKQNKKKQVDKSWAAIIAMTQFTKNQRLEQ